MINVPALNHVFFYNSKFHSKLAIYLTFSALTFLGIAEDEQPSTEKGESSPNRGVENTSFEKENIALSTSIQSHLLSSLNIMRDLGVSQTRETEIQNINCPATLTEFGHLTGSNGVLTNVTNSIADAVSAYMKARTSSISGPLIANPTPKPPE